MTIKHIIKALHTVTSLSAFKVLIEWWDDRTGLMFRLETVTMSLSL